MVNLTLMLAFARSHSIGVARSTCMSMLMNSGAQWRAVAHDRTYCLHVRAPGETHHPLFLLNVMVPRMHLLHLRAKEIALTELTLE